MNKKTIWTVVGVLAALVLVVLFVLSLHGYIPLTYTQVDRLDELQHFLDSPRDDMRGIKVNGHFLEIGKRRSLQILPGYSGVMYAVRPYRQVQIIPRNMTRAEILDMCLGIDAQGLQTLKSGKDVLVRPAWQGRIDDRLTNIYKATRFTYVVIGVIDQPIYLGQVELAKRLGMGDSLIMRTIIPVQSTWLAGLKGLSSLPPMSDIPDGLLVWLSSK